MITFVDDVRVTGSSKKQCRGVRRQFASRMQYLGIQDAPRKYRLPSKSNTGAWTGTIFSVDKDVISKRTRTTTHVRRLHRRASHYFVDSSHHRILAAICVHDLPAAQALSRQFFNDFVERESFAILDMKQRQKFYSALSNHMWASLS